MKIIMTFCIIGVCLYQTNDQVDIFGQGMLKKSDNINLLFAHSGRTDKYGCHNDWKKGTYHCH